MAAKLFRRYLLPGVAALALLLVAACGASEAPATEPEPAGSGQPQTAAQPAAPAQDSVAPTSSAPAAAATDAMPPAGGQNEPVTTAASRPAGRSTLVPTPTPAPVVEPAMEQSAVGILNIAYSQLGPPKFIPKISGSPQTSINISAVWESMWHSDPQGNVIPRLVKQWEVSDDGNVWTLHLEEGVQFHKGKGEMTAQDMIWSMDNIVSEGTVPGVWPSDKPSSTPKGAV